MTVGERIKRLCDSHGTTIKKLERELDFGNGSLALATDKIQAGRANKIAEYFDVPLKYIVTGELEDSIQQGEADIALLKKIGNLNSANRQLLNSIIDSMIDIQNKPL